MNFKVKILLSFKPDRNEQLFSSGKSTTRTGKDSPSSTIYAYPAPKNIQKHDIINISSSSTEIVNGKEIYFET